MKIRNGFVSNSSSSSFILLVNKQSAVVILDQMETEFPGITQKILDSSQTTEFHNSLFFHGGDSHGEAWGIFDHLSYEQWEEFEDRVKKLSKDKYFYNEEEC